MTWNWEEHPGINCYLYHGMDEVINPNDVPVYTATLEDCKAACVAEPKCAAITVNQGGFDKKNKLGRCFLRGVFELKKCNRLKVSGLAFDTHVMKQLFPPPLPRSPSPTYPPDPPPAPPLAPIDPEVLTARAAHYHDWLRRILAESGGSSEFSQLHDTFETEEDLRSSVWAKYFEKTYVISRMHFPFSLALLHFFISDRMPPSVFGTLKFGRLGGACIRSSCSGYGGLFKHAGVGWMNDHRAHEFRGDVWRVHRKTNAECRSPGCSLCNPEIAECALGEGAPDHGIIEVSHKCCDTSKEGNAYWM